jgi:hypothetical protein
MALPPESFSDDEFGYDLSVEEEQLLLQLGTDPSQSRPVLESSRVDLDGHAVNETLDAVPGVTDLIHADHDHALATHTTRPPTLVSKGDAAVQLPDVLSPPPTYSFDIVYPDCRSLSSLVLTSRD